MTEYTKYTNRIVGEYRKDRSTYLNYGKYCGPGWTGGRFTSSDVSDDYNVPPINDLDAACKLHDIAYGNAKSIQDYLDADAKLVYAAKELIEKGEMDPATTMY